MNPLHVVLSSSLLTAQLAAATAPPTAQQLEFFENRIRPVLAQECYECHSEAGKQKGGLLLDSRPGWQAGGDSGPAIAPGKPEASLLLQSIQHAHDDLKMPKNGAKLDETIIADFQRWIAEGAPDPRDAAPNKAQLEKETSWESVLERRKQWWCFQPVKPCAQPLTSALVDSYVDAKLKTEGLKPAPWADAATLARRVSYVVTGLPPGPDEVRKFVKDTEGAAQPGQTQAYQEMVERLLASPAYGERWARHWLDWVRYAESYGSEGDPAIPYAWRYRDYVIRAFNGDLPYPRMVEEAIAGDLLPNPRINQNLGINESALGIGQLRMVLHGFSPTDSLDELVTFTDNQVDTVTKAFQGLTVSCARCHNHKFDAISQADFYALYGIFTSTRPAVVDVSAPGLGQVERQELRDLKAKIRQVVGQAWLEAAKKLPEVKATPAAVSSTPAAARRWDLRTETWYANGEGINQGATAPGEFSVDVEGKGIIARVHGGGVYSDVISTRDRAVLMSPRFRCEGGTLWMRVAGGGGARARYIVQNYPRTGTIHKAKELSATGDETLGWHKLDLNYWKGDDIFIQCTTVADMPVETKVDARSWFGMMEAFITFEDGAPVAAKASGSPLPAVEAWVKGNMTEEQAALLDRLLRESVLPNSPEAIPAAAPLLTRYRDVEKRLPAPVRAPGVLEADGHDAPLFVRGDHKQPAQPVPRRFLDGVDPTPYQPQGSGRLELARSLVDARNPLTYRVIVNRVWHHVFGAGLVATPDNFGRLGSPPTHPELLDALASTFQSSGGSMKNLVRTLVMTEAFQRGHERPAPALAKDPENKLLAGWTVRRLEAEAVRDGIVALSGQMDPAMYGEPVPGNDPRRSIYVQVIRNRLTPFLSAFDFPVPFSTRGRRDVTNVPAQSLALLNDPTISGWARLWARTVQKEAKEPVERVRQMFMESMGRSPSAQELETSLEFVKESEALGQQQRAALAEVQARAAELQERLEKVLDPARVKLTAQSSKPVLKDGPEPYAEWDFETDGRDLQGRLPLTLEGGARVENGALILDGRQAFARSVPLPKNLSSKTLEAWVQLDTLDQQGGGVITLQDRRGAVFDSIVFGEKDPRHWLAGSDHHNRTQSFKGPLETEAATRPIHVAVVYDGPKVTAYRDGQAYGSGYKTEKFATFKTGDAEVLLGCRHGSPSPSRVLHGRILRARLYNRALTPLEVEVTRQVEASVITDRDVLDSLPDALRAEVRLWQKERENLRQQTAEMERQLERLNPESAGWESLALSLINLKEFVYLR